MGKKNYTNYNNMKNKKEAADKVEEVVKAEVVEEPDCSPVEAEEVVGRELKTPQEPVVTVAEAKPLVGVVTGCTRLNVRLQPSRDSRSLCVLAEGSKVVVEPNSTTEWYGVRTKDGVTGYCMKKFITIK